MKKIRYFQYEYCIIEGWAQTSVYYDDNNLIVVIGVFKVINISLNFNKTSPHFTEIIYF